MKNTFLISGCQGDIGISICKSIKDEWPDSFVIGTDLDQHGSGEIFFDKIITIPKASESNYASTLKQLIKEHSPKVFIPTSEPELKFFQKFPNEMKEFGAPCILANQLSMLTGFDKLKTQEHLESSQFPFLKTFDSRNYPDSLSFPVILKPRSASGSSGLKVVKDKFELEILKFMQGEFVLQEFMNGPEFTSCVFSDGNQYKAITLERTLRYGVSISAHPIFDEKINDYLVKIAKTLDLKGSINFQFKIGSDGLPYIFEINPRFSSTVYYRHMLGFKDVIWSIQAALSQKVNLDVTIKNKRLVRYFEDVLV